MGGAQWDGVIPNVRAILAKCRTVAMDGRHGTAVPCAIGNVMSRIATTAIRGTSEDVTDINVGNKEKTGD